MCSDTDLSKYVKEQGRMLKEEQITTQVEVTIHFMLHLSNQISEQYVVLPQGAHTSGV